jgi:glycosyltransferase involved in cell wall biosynthesis
MKILHLVYDHIDNPWVGGGGAIRVNELCKRVAASGHDVTIISGKYPSAKDYRENGIEYRFVGTERNYLLSTFSYAFMAAMFVRRHGREFDVIVEDFAPWNPVFSRFLTKTPVILHVNHREGIGVLKRWLLPGVPFFLIELFYPRLFRHITALSEGTKTKIRIKKAAIVPAGIPQGLIDAGEEGGEEDYLLYVGRLHIKNKGLDTLMAAMKVISGARLLIAGRGRDEDKLKEMASKIDGDKVEFAGFVSEERKMDLLKASKMLVLPSRFEGWGIVVLEAAAFGKPVVVSDIPELNYAAEAGFGLSFKAGDSGGLAEKISFLLKNETLRREMGRNAREYARRYTWERISVEYGKYLEDVVKDEREN